jgi:hypothetical protein
MAGLTHFLAPGAVFLCWHAAASILVRMLTRLLATLIVSSVLLPGVAYDLADRCKQKERRGRNERLTGRTVWTFCLPRRIPQRLRGMWPV